MNKQLPHLPYMKARVYYAQNREDLILDSFFKGRKKGYYVDVGAYDPRYDSVTQLFYSRGWNGINIEPQPDRFKVFEEERDRDINLNVGVASKKGLLTLRSYKNQGLSTFSQRIKDDYESNPDYNTSEYEDVVVKVLTLEEIFKKNSVDHISFMKIDVEGFEEEVIKGNDWGRYRPEVLCIESNHGTRDWKNFLIKKVGYKEVFFDGLNLYFALPDSEAIKSFSYINHIVIERGGGLRIEDYEAMKALQSRISELDEIIYKADVELKNKQKLLEATQDELIELGSIRGSLKHVVKLLIMRRKGTKHEE